MGIIIASMALFVGLVALWLASTNIKKIEIGNREVKSQLTSDIAKAKRELERQLDIVDRKMGGFDGKMEGVIELQSQARDKVAVIEKELVSVSEELKKLINSIPPQYHPTPATTLKAGSVKQLPLIPSFFIP